MKFRLLKEDEIELRVGNVSAKGYSLLLYKNARADMNILDETVGAEKWQRKHYEVKGNMYCSVGIKCDNEWVWKDDCGVESNTEKEKGESSDSFKRACVNWGIGRELYTSPFIFIPCETNAKAGKGYDLPDNEKYRKFKINLIEYVASKISKLVVSDVKTGEIVFPQKGYSTQKVKEELPIKIEELEIKSDEKSCYHCNNCNNKITDKVANYSKSKLGYELCMDCQKLLKEERELRFDELPF